ncbi:hypothetical protein GCM10011369_29150 [Neiella marina]|uniref:Uncharacterized protein n=1 Tax=Neiella marina TaxID=508461 RepID=A0A8J2XQK0_9GAMM|nr:hypothetical protein [Neiella marina]GGA85290.1 hypothetical protein GCM10011369_29150 [Neiella marina]
MSDFWAALQQFDWGDFTLIAAWLMVLINWRSPIIRNLALANVIIALIGGQLMAYIRQMPYEQLQYFWYLGAASVNFIKALFILGLISFNIAYLCKTAGQLMAIFTLLGVLNIIRFTDRFIVEHELSGGLLAASYSILVPALNLLALIALALPAIQRLLHSNSRNQDRYPEQY